ncbi:cyclic nucleotide-gated ion channel 1-like [Prunus avium]|uniref:Cyclic nucleotide-gated ion channel 1-like n=1 Tax=Prunus avium TaxID=42229 RepID=A0A6P5TDZ2_PRUAV|nr:cyclic nucleotide-gated ion channel 1-like [Prunus avium]
MVRSLYPHPDVVLYEGPKRPSIVETIEEVVANVVGILRFIIDEYLMYQEDNTGNDLDEDSNRLRIRKLEGEHIQETLRRIFFSPLTRKMIFILSCVAVSIDPLFFYIPIINEEKKCLGIDKNLRAAALCLRALPDAAFVLHTISSGFRLYPNVDLYFVDLLYYSFVSLLVAVFLILPIPQLAIVVFFFKSGGSGHFGQRVTVNIFLFIYYVARVFLIFIYSQNLKYKTGKWVRASFNFLLYIIASNVVGGFWYFFSIQREISCWDQSCRNGIGCGGPTYYCSGSTSRDITFLNELCPINPQNTTIFNFGIFFDAIQSGSTRSIHFPTKFFYCIWWGVKNLR